MAQDHILYFRDFAFYGDLSGEVAAACTFGRVLDGRPFRVPHNRYPSLLVYRTIAGTNVAYDDKF